MAVTHYLEALDFQKEIVKIHTIFGGKNPHPNWLVGGVPCPINVDGVGAAGAINMERLNRVRYIAERGGVPPQVYIPDLLAIGGFYRDWLRRRALRQEHAQLRRHPRAGPTTPAHNLPFGGRDPQRRPLQDPLVTSRIPSRCREFVTHSWYKYADETKGLHPGTASPSPTTRSGPRAQGHRTTSSSSTRAPSTVDQGAAGAATRWRSGPCRDGAGATCSPRSSHPRDDRRRAQEARRAGDALFSTLAAPPRGRSNRLLLRPAARRDRPAGGQHQGRRHRHRQRREVGAVHLAEGDARARFHRGAARRARPLGQDPRRQDRELPVRGADHLERQPARCQGPDRRLRGQL